MIKKKIYFRWITTTSIFSEWSFRNDCVRSRNRKKAIAWKKKNDTLSLKRLSGFFIFDSKRKNVFISIVYITSKSDAKDYNTLTLIREDFENFNLWSIELAKREKIAKILSYILTSITNQRFIKLKIARIKSSHLIFK